MGLHADGEPQGEHHGSRRLAYEPRGERRERLGYLTHRVVDGGKARVILDVLVTGAEVTEKLPVLEMLFRSRFRRRLRPRSVAGTQPTAPTRTWWSWRRRAIAPTPCNPAVEASV